MLTLPSYPRSYFRHTRAPTFVIPALLLSSYPRLPRVSRRAQHPSLFRLPPLPFSVIPACAGMTEKGAQCISPTTVCGLAAAPRGQATKAAQRRAPRGRRAASPRCGQAARRSPSPERRASAHAARQARPFGRTRCRPSTRPRPSRAARAEAPRRRVRLAVVVAAPALDRAGVEQRAGMTPADRDRHRPPVVVLRIGALPTAAGAQGGQCEQQQRAKRQAQRRGSPRGCGGHGERTSLWDATSCQGCAQANYVAPPHQVD